MLVVPAKKLYAASTVLLRECQNLGCNINKNALIVMCWRQLCISIFSCFFTRKQSARTGDQQCLEQEHCKFTCHAGAQLHVPSAQGIARNSFCMVAKTLTPLERSAHRIPVPPS